MQRDILAALVPRIDQLLEQAITRLSGKGGSDLRKGADFALLSLRAPTLAVITARTALTTIRLPKGHQVGAGKQLEERRIGGGPERLFALRETLGRWASGQKKNPTITPHAPCGDPMSRVGLEGPGRAWGSRSRRSSSQGKG